MSIDRRKILKGSVLATTGALASPYIISSPVRAAGTVNVGVLFSLTGGLSIIEKSLHDATLMAISEINAAVGAKGMKINAIVEDGASDPKTYNEKASKLVIQDKVPTVFGSYTSASRKAVLPVFEKRNNLYFYPTYYEGFECSKNVVYTGAVPNQQLSNFIPWIIKTLGKKKFFIVGSNYIYPREMAKVSKILIEKNGGEWIADEYLELGHSEWGSMGYKNQGLTHDKLPICATVTSEIEIAAMGPEYAVGSFTSFPYFQAIDTDRNKAFVERYRAFVKDPKAVTHHALESSYFQVFLWKQAVEKAAEITPAAIREAVKGQEFDAPNGHVKIDPDNLHTYLTPRIAQWLPDGQGKIIDAYKEPTIPLPYVAHGEMVMIGAYVTVLCGIWLGLNIFAAIPIAFAVTALIGLAIERVIVRRLYGRLLDTLLATWGIAILIQQAVRLELGLSFFGIHIPGLGPGLQNVSVPLTLQGTFMLGSPEINRYRAFIIVVTAVLTALSWLIMYRTPFGTQVRAIIRNPKMAAACGIDVARVNALTFALGSGLAGVAGVMMSGFKTVFPDMGTPMVVDGFMVVVMGGVGSLLGSVFSAGILGEINGLVAAGTNDILARAVVFGVVIMIIILKPKGLFSLRGR